MTKQQEIEVLDKAIVALGPDSYLGPWLGSVRAEVESAIRSDYFPEITLAAAREQSLGIVQQARDQAEAIRAVANQDAKRTRDSANNFRDNIIDSLRDAIRTIERP